MKNIIRIEIRAQTIDRSIWIIGVFNVYNNIDIRRFAATQVKELNDEYGNSQKGVSWFDFVQNVKVCNMITGEELFEIEIDPKIN